MIRDKATVLKFLRKPLARYGTPSIIVTNGIASYGAALKDIGDENKKENQKLSKQPGRKLASTLSTTKMCHIALSAAAKLAKIRFGTCLRL